MVKLRKEYPDVYKTALLKKIDVFNYEHPGLKAVKE